MVYCMIKTTVYFLDLNEFGGLTDSLREDGWDVHKQREREGSGLIGKRGGVHGEGYRCVFERTDNDDTYVKVRVWDSDLVGAIDSHFQK